MLAHRRAFLIPRLTGRDNYREWSRKVELHMRVNKLWPAVLSTPKPVRNTAANQDEFILVAAPNRIYLQCPDELTVRVKLFLCQVIDSTIMPENCEKMSVPRLWMALRRAFRTQKPEHPLSLDAKKKAGVSAHMKGKNVWILGFTDRGGQV